MHMQPAHGSDIEINIAKCIYIMFSGKKNYHSMKKAFHMSGKSTKIISPVI